MFIFEVLIYKTCVCLYAIKLWESFSCAVQCCLPYLCSAGQLHVNCKRPFGFHQRKKLKARWLKQVIFWRSILTSKDVLVIATSHVHSNIISFVRPDFQCSFIYSVTDKVLHLQYEIALEYRLTFILKVFACVFKICLWCWDWKYVYLKISVGTLSVFSRHFSVFSL